MSEIGNSNTNSSSANAIKAETISDERLNKSYLDKRSVTISLKKNTSKYREVNRTTLPDSNQHIGGSIRASQILTSNDKELQKYFPKLIGVSYTDSSFIKKAKDFMANIQIVVGSNGVTFNTSFRYNRYEDYLKISKEEESIENEYKAIDKSNPKNLKDGLKRKIERIQDLEVSKCDLGSPENVTDYLMYRHCLLYNDIAKDVSLINSDPNYRFYFKDDNKEKDMFIKHRDSVNKAKTNYVRCIEDGELLNAIYVQYCLMYNIPVSSVTYEEQQQKEISVDRFSTTEPVKFNKLCANKDIKLMATIEILIAIGELVRHQYNQTISNREGTTIGNNIKEAIVWFKNPINNSTVNTYYNKLKNI